MIMGAYRLAISALRWALAVCVALALDLLECFGPGMLVLADRKFLSWAFLVLVYLVLLGPIVLPGSGRAALSYVC